MRWDACEESETGAEGKSAKDENENENVDENKVEDEERISFINNVFINTGNKSTTLNTLFVEQISIPLTIYILYND